jgi:hypothetical protein
LDWRSRNEDPLRISGAHHFGGHFYDEGARREALGLEQEAVHGAGDNEGFSARESMEADAGNFVGGFSDAHGTVWLLRDLLKFGFRRAWAEGADADAEFADLFGNCLGEEEVEGLGGRIDSEKWNGLERCSGAHDKDVAMPPGDHRGKVESREMHDGGTIDLDHSQQFFDGDFVAVAEGAESSVVDEQFDFDIFSFGEGVDFCGSFGTHQVGGEDLGLNFVGGGQFGGEFLEAVSAAGGEDEIRSTGCQLLRECQSDSGARASNQCPLTAPLSRHGSLLTFLRNRRLSEIPQPFNLFPPGVKTPEGSTLRHGSLGFARDKFSRALTKTADETLRHNSFGSTPTFAKATVGRRDEFSRALTKTIAIVNIGQARGLSYEVGASSSVA